MFTDAKYQSLLKQILDEGELIHTRNAWAHSHISLPNTIFTETPLVTVRKTAWKMALREMQWFMSGDSECPAELLPWWANQLSPEGHYFAGYADQFRRCGSGFDTFFDQIQYVLDGIIHNQNSRRLVLTTWNPWEMANITKLNNNPNTPTCCHSTLIQCFVREDKLYMTSYQRSADMLLGVPHNWCQSWALLLWLAYHADLKVGHLQWIFGDGHVYAHQTHVDTAKALIALNSDPAEANTFNLIYRPLGEEAVFLADDFVMLGEIPAPTVVSKPVLL